MSLVTCKLCGTEGPMDVIERICHACEGEHGRAVVHVFDNRVEALTGGHRLRIADQKRHPLRFFVHPAFVLVVVFAKHEQRAADQP